MLRISAVLLTTMMVAAACGDDPLAAVGDRSSEWIGEPTVVTTTTLPTTVPVTIDAGVLKWFNDGLGGGLLDDPDALRAAVFARRGGDRFVQASRAEIVTLLPDVLFPATVPYLSEYVTSQLVFNNDGNLADDPTVAFGIWSSQPYTRSRSVAQMVVIRVALDAVAAAEVAEPGAEIDCTRFSDRSTETCDILELAGRPVWSLRGSSGRTLVFYDQRYRYEVYARTFVPDAALEQMTASFAPLGDLPAAEG